MNLSLLLLAAALATSSRASVPDDIRTAPGSETWPQDDGILVRQHLRVHVAPDGRVERTTESAVKVFTAWVAQHDMLDPRIDWNDARADLVVDEVVTWMADGTEVAARANSLVSNTAPELEWAVPYAFLRQVVVSHVGVEEGSTSLIRYRITDHAPSGLPAWGVVDLRGALPVLDQRVEVAAPAGTPLHWAVVGGDATPEVALTGDGVRLALHRRDVGSVNLPERGLGVERLAWSTARDWAQVRGLLEARVEPALVLDPETAARVDEIADGSLSASERLDRLHGFVVEGIRAVARPVADVDYAVRPAPEVLRSSVAHALDRAVLLVALLREAGFEAHVALAGTSRVWAPDVPTPDQLPDVWVRARVGTHDVWMDPTAGRDQRNRTALWGRPVLVLDGHATVPTLLAPPRADENRAALRLEVDLVPGADGIQVSAVGDLDLLGRYNPLVAFDRSQDRASRVAGRLSGVLGGARPESVVTATRTCDLTALRAEYAAGRLAPDGAGLVRLQVPRVPGAVEGRALQAWRQRRTEPLELPGPLREEVVVRWKLPAGWVLARTPEPFSLRNGVGSVSREVLREDGQLEVRTTFVLDVPEVPAAQWPELRVLLAALDAEGSRVALLQAPEE